MSESPVIIGEDRAAEQPERRRWQRGRGWVRVITLEGTRAQIEAEGKKYAREDTGIDSIDMDLGPGVSSLEMTPIDPDDDASENEALVTIWELETIDMRIPLAQLQDDAGAFVFDQAYVLYAEDSIRKAYYPADLEWGAEPVTVPESNITKYLKLRRRGVTHVLRSRYLLRKTVSCASNSEAEASYTNVNKVDSDPGAPTTLLGSIPSGEWLKKGPKVREVAQSPSRWSIVQEWWWAKKWSELLYGGTLTP